MREIKFRAWDGRMTLPFDIWKIQDTFNMPSSFTCESKPILMQYIGLKDKTGREIYEGDIINWNGKNLVVEFLNGAYTLMEGDIHYRWLVDDDVLSMSMEVIGNIYENPEML